VVAVPGDALVAAASWPAGGATVIVFTVTVTVSVAAPSPHTPEHAGRGSGKQDGRQLRWARCSSDFDEEPAFARLAQPAR
jgi:hypothetical protein